MDGNGDRVISVDAPKCAHCGRVARIVTTIPKIGDVRDIKVFAWVACGIIDCRRGGKRSARPQGHRRNDHRPQFHIGPIGVWV
jgi:hypothetical protein